MIHSHSGKKERFFETFMCGHKIMENGSNRYVQFNNVICSIMASTIYSSKGLQANWQN